ncbi:MAG: copper resistance protein NlpE [Clostridiaceae bacterium]|nr:copper resistance protein NlpE [Clostridiaceae bacterium]
MKKFFKIFLPLLLIVALVSCQQEEKKPYVGTWADDNMTITLNDDNTFEIKDKDGAIKGKYEIIEDELKLVVEEVFEENPVNENIKVGDEIKVKFKVENDVLSVTYDGKVYDFPKK